MPLEAEGEFARGRQHLEQAIGKSGQPTKWGSIAHEHDLYAMLADAAAQERDEAALRQYTPLAEEFAVRDGHLLYQAITHRAWGVAKRLTGEYTESEARLNQALELFDGLGTRWQIGRTLFELGELALAQMDTVRARDCYARALTAFEGMKAVPDAERTRVALRSLSVNT